MPFVTVGGLEMHHTDTGSGPVALLVHGFPLDGTVWAEQVTALAGEGRRCVVPDLAGFGRSAPPGAATLPMERHADDLAELLDVLAVDLVDLVGLSMGGYVALAFLERHPGRVRSLGLVDTKSTADTDEGKAGRDAAAARLLEVGREAFAADMSKALLGPGAGVWLQARVRQMIESTRYETIVAALAGLRDRPDRSVVLAGGDLPVAVVVGEHDAVTPPAAAEAMAALRPGITLDVVPGVGHLAPIEAPDAVATALRRLFASAG